jgi:hypothetical protein
MSRRIYTQKFTVTLLDTWFERSYEMEYREAKPLEDKYPTRYVVRRDTALLNYERENKIMPTMPTKHVPLPNGLHTLVTASHKASESKYGPQEVIECICEDVEGSTPQRLYISHDSYPKVKAAIDAGIVVQNGDDWEVLDGVRFRAVVSNGKFTSLLKVE